MSDLSILCDMIHCNAKIQLQTEYNKHFVVLEEEKSPDSTVTIAGLPSDTIVINLDDNISNDRIFNGSRGECKRADYLIIAEAQNKKRILIIEMKTSKDKPKNVINQLKGASCCVRYLQEVGKKFWNQDEFLNDYELRYIYLNHTSKKPSVRKRRVRNNQDVGDQPETAVEISWATRLDYNKISGKQ